MTKNLKNSLNINDFVQSLINFYEMANEKNDNEKKTLTVPSHLVPKGIRTKVAEKFKAKKGIKLVYQKMDKLNY